MAKRDFFVSYTSSDEVDAQWIASTLKKAGYSTWTMSEDSAVGVNFVLEMHKALEGCRRLLLTLSAKSLKSRFVALEWASALAKDPTGRSLVPVRVQKCAPTGLLRAIVYCDLVGLTRPAARAKLLAAIRPPASDRPRRARARRKAGRKDMSRVEVRALVTRELGPSAARADVSVDSVLSSIQQGLKRKSEVSIAGLGTFRTKTRKARVGRNPSTGASVRITPSKAVSFTPAKPAVVTPVEREAGVVRELRDLLETTRATFLAQVELRDDLVRDVGRRLGADGALEYEEFFEKYFTKMTEAELGVHARIRGYTSAVLATYNARVLKLLGANRPLFAKIPRLSELQRHLRAWTTKFEGEFASSPWICVLYVGVVEGVAFPSGIEGDLEDFLKGR